jgi:hypothetical protein
MKRNQNQKKVLWKRLSLILTPILFITLSPSPARAQTSVNGVGLYDAPHSSVVSTKYKVRIKPTGQPDADYRIANVLISQLNPTYVEGGHELNQKYYSNLWGCSHSYLNFETTGSVDIEVERIGGGSISDATRIYPENKISNVTFFSSKVKFTMSRPCNVAIDINGEMQNRAHQTSASNPTAVDTLSIHGNHPLEDKPSIGGANVQVVEPNPNPTNEAESAIIKPVFTSASTKEILYFKPGIHYIGNNFKVYPGKKYYISGDAIVYGTFNNTIDSTEVGHPIAGLGDAVGVWFFGHGTISGKRFQHWELDKIETDGLYDGIGQITVNEADKNFNPTNAAYTEQQRISYRKNAIELSNARSSKVQGLVIVDPANHSTKLFNAGLDSSQMNEVSWVKIFGWRVNSDGSGINDSSIVHNCFYRVQDDGYYPKGVALAENVLWSDANGVPLRLSHLHQFKSISMLDQFKTNRMHVEKIDVIFRRNMNWSESAAIELPPEDDVVSDRRFIFSNINISDRRSPRSPINIQQGKNGALSNLRFENINIEAMPSAAPDNKNTLYADTNGSIKDLVFHNLTIGGELVTDANWTNFFKTTKTRKNGNGTFTELASQGTVTAPSFKNSMLPKTDWTAKSNPNVGTPGNAIDGDRSNRWDTHGVQSAAQWIEVDMKDSKIFDRIILDTVGSSDDFPRGYRVYVSDATIPTSWGSPVATGSGAGAVTVITFPRQKGRHIKIEQTGSTTYNYWSIHELSVFESGALDPTGWLASASSNQGSAGVVLNGNSGDRWSTGTFQSPTADQYFQVNMLSSKTFDRISLDCSESPHDYPRGYEVLVSNDGSSWSSVPIAVGKGFGPLTTITFLEQNAQYIKVKQIGTSTSKWWSIHKFNVHKPASALPSLPSPWQISNVGTAGGVTSVVSGTWTMISTSGDIFGGSDSFRYANQTMLSGDCSIVAEIAKIESSSTFAKMGVMIREATLADSPYAFLCIWPDNTIKFQYRTTSGSFANEVSISASGNPRWLKLTRTGVTFKAFTSSTGQANDWTECASAPFTMSNGVRVGLASSSQDPAQFSTCTIKNISVTAP